jgi:hypothetical protein
MTFLPQKRRRRDYFLSSSTKTEWQFMFFDELSMDFRGLCDARTTAPSLNSSIRPEAQLRQPGVNLLDRNENDVFTRKLIAKRSVITVVVKSAQYRLQFHLDWFAHTVCFGSRTHA